MSWIGVRTLYIKEVLRFLKVYNQTILAPIINTLLFFIILRVVIKDHTQDYDYHSKFIASGLIIMIATQGAYLNTSSLIIAKVMGIISDYLAPPFKNWQLIFANVTAAITRGFVVAFISMLCMIPFVDLSCYSITICILYLILACTLSSLLGIISGFLSNTFDQAAIIGNYVVSPLIFLSGTFYSVKKLPEFWYQVSQINPFFYFIDGFRFGIIGTHESNLYVGVTLLCIINTILWCITQRILVTGYRIKS